MTGGRFQTNAYQKSQTGGKMNNLNDTNAKDITLQYLIALYGKDKGLSMFAESQSHIFDYHGLAWALGKECFPYFCEIFLHDLLFDYSGDNVPLSETHYSIWNELQETMLHRNNTRNCYVFPRAFGKSTTITIPVALWAALYCIHPFVVVDSATEAQAQNFINTMKIQIEDNRYIKSCFGEVINKNLKYNASEIELDIVPQRSKIQCVSSTSSVRGINYGSFRVGLLILDDAQDEKQITTEKACADLVSRINNGILKALQNKNNHVIALGTIQRKGDLYDSFVDSTSWKVRCEKCMLVDDVDYYFNHNEHWQKIKKILRSKHINDNALFDAETYYMEHKEECDFPVIWENYDCFKLALEYFEDSISFKKERQCDIKSLGEKRITALSCIPSLDIEQMEFTNTILSVDPAAVNKSKSDYSAFCVLSDTSNHIKYARKCIIDKIEFNEYIDLIISLLLKYPDINTLSIEKQVYMGADVVKLRERISVHPELQNRPLNIINKSRTKNKDNRIGAIIPDINMGRIIFNEDDTDAIEQIKEFAGTAYTEHDDMIDALADAVENIAENNTPIPMLRVLDWSKYGL